VDVFGVVMVKEKDIPPVGLLGGYLCGGKRKA